MGNPHASSCTPENRREGWFPGECAWCHATVVWDAHRVRMAGEARSCACAACAWVESVTQRRHEGAGEVGHLRHRHGAENRTGPDDVNGE